MKELRDKVAAVTGAASGIGRALALRLAAEGCHVALADLDESGLEACRREAEAAGVKASAQVLDVADRRAVQAWADRVVESHGRVNLVVNNAGVALDADVEAMSYEDFEWLMAINFWGVVYGTKAFLPHLKASGEGQVVNVSSVFGMIGVPGQSAYNAAKFAVRGFTESLRQELEIEGAPVSALCVHPGGIKTSIVRNARIDAGRDMDRDQAAAEFDRLARSSPEQAAEAIVAGIQGDRRRVLIGRDARLIDLVQRLLPTGYQWILARAVARRRAKLQREGSAQPASVLPRSR